MQNIDTYLMKLHQQAHNFETSSVLILIVFLGKFVESYSKMKTVEKISDLASLKVSKANLINEKDASKVNFSSKISVVPVELLEINDFVRVFPGDVIPTDGVVFIGKGLCNESMLTGEEMRI
jgi:P-type E1-E2 ATPase